MSLYRQHSHTIDLVLLDVTMPKMSGLEALEVIRSISREVPAILASGYSARGHQEILARDPHTSFVAKPYSLDELLGRVQALLAVT